MQSSRHSELHSVEIDVHTPDGHTLVLDRYDGSTRAGSGGVLLLHGLSQQGRFWTPVLRRLTSRPVAALDQRGHGRSDVPVDSDFSIGACAEDAITALDAAGMQAPVVIVGHSWGASVALQAAVSHPDRVQAVVLVDGGAWSIPLDADRTAARERLRPPELGIPEAELWKLVAASMPWFDEETQEALTPTFIADDTGAIRTRIGVERHMAVLDGILDWDVKAAWTRLRTPVWVVSCESGTPRDLGVTTLVPDGTAVVVQRWEGAEHDVPLQWPALVAGLIDQVAEGAAA